MLEINLWLCFKTSFSVQARCGVRTRVLSWVLLGLMLELDCIFNISPEIRVKARFNIRVWAC